MTLSVYSDTQRGLGMASRCVKHPADRFTGRSAGDTSAAEDRDPIR